MTDLEYIDLYFQGTPPPDEKSRFEKRVQEDPAFAEEVAFYLSVEKLARDRALEEKKKHFRQLYRENPPGAAEAGDDSASPQLAPVRPIRRMSYISAAAAALLCIIAGAYLALRPPAPERLANEYVDTHLNKLGVSMSSTEDSLQTGLRLYNEGKLPEAARTFEQVLQRDTAQFVAKKYAGIAYLRLNDFDRALLYFGQLERYTDLYANPARLYQAVTYMKRNGPGDREQARQLLQQIVDQNLEGKSTAEQWLRKL